MHGQRVLWEVPSDIGKNSSFLLSVYVASFFPGYCIPHGAWAHEKADVSKQCENRWEMTCA